MKGKLTNSNSVLVCLRSRLHRSVAAPDTDDGTADRVAHAALSGQVRLHTGQEGGGGGAAKHRRLDTRHQGQKYSKKGTVS